MSLSPEYCAAEQVPGCALVTLGGSRAHGTAREGSVLDLAGVYVAGARAIMSLRPPPRTVKLPDRDVTIYELHHFCKLAAAANPTVLEILAAPLLWGNELGYDLRRARRLFYSRSTAATYGGYAISQLRKADTGTGGSRGAGHHKREKFLLHTLRLLVTGTRLLRTGYLEVALTAGEVADLREVVAAGLPTVHAHARHLLAELDAAAADSPLPEVPDYDGIADLIVDVRSRVN